ncbi:MAG: pyridoxamine 5'-phosphate oxidase family protein [Gammaproteobacteria bacterium]
MTLTCTTAIAEETGKKGPVGINVGAGEQGHVAIIYDGPPLTSDQVKSAGHRSYSRGMTCSECHDVKYDFMSTASEQFVNNFPQLSQEQIWQKVVTFLPGRERFALATSMDDQPIATTVDMVLDKDERVFYVVSEIGTEKLLQLRVNPKMSAVRFAGWTVAEGGKQEWRSVQMRGTAEVIPSTDPRFDKTLVKYNLVRVTLARAHRRFDLIRVTPMQIFYFDTTLADDQKSVYQLWERSQPPG